MEIEPLEEVVDDLVDAMKANHLTRLANGKCNVYSGSDFIDVLGDIAAVGVTDQHAVILDVLAELIDEA